MTNPQFRVYVDIGHGEKGKVVFQNPGAVSGVFKEHDNECGLWYCVSLNG